MAVIWIGQSLLYSRPVRGPHLYLNTYRGEGSEPDAFARPWFTLKYGSQKRTKGLKTGQKTAKDAIPWFTLKNGSQKRTQNLDLHFFKWVAEPDRKLLNLPDLHYTTLFASVIVQFRGFSSSGCPQLWTEAAPVYNLEVSFVSGS